MIAVSRLVMALSLSGALFSAVAGAASWQDQLSSVASKLEQGSSSQTTDTAAASQGGFSLSSLTGLLNGGDSALSSGTMTNAAGILGYCAQNNLVDNNVDAVKDKLLGKLGLQDTQKQEDTTDYQQGLMGLLNPGSGKTLDLKALGDTPLGKQVKTKACDLVLKQGASFLS